MFLFLLLWLIAITIIFSFEVVAGLYWYKFSKENILFDSKLNNIFIQKYNYYFNFSSYWFLVVFSFFNGVLTGWIIENRLKILSRINHYWQQQQPEFYRNTKGEVRSILPWLIVELPVLIIVLINIFLIVAFKSYTNTLVWILFFTIGFIVGQLIEPLKEYRTTIDLDRPEKPVSAIIHKVLPNFPLQYSLFLGQFYCRVMLPFFFLYLAVLIPGWFIIIPNHTNENMLIILFSILTGTLINWAYEKKENFFFAKITVFNILFVIFKSFILLAIIFIVLVKYPYLFLLLLVSILSGFIISWHPEKLRS